MSSKDWSKERYRCPKCDSSDGLAISVKGTGYCHSCERVIQKEDIDGKDERHSDEVHMDKGNWNNKRVKYQYLDYRGVKAKTWEFFRARTAVSEDGPEYIEFPYAHGRTLFKTPDKKFLWTGEKTGDVPLFGMDKFPPGSAKSITITEGALDAASVYQMFDRKYPVVSVTNATAAKSDCGKGYDYLNSFDKIYLCFDMDDPGQKAAKEVARLFDFNKVYVLSMVHKDANEYLEKGEIERFKKDWWAAQRFLPEGILSSYAAFDKVIDEDKEKPSVPYPFGRLQSMTYGIRSGEVVLMTAQEGMGKTEIFRALEYHLLKTTDDNIGIIHLEENKARTVKGLVGYEVKSPIHLPDFQISKEDIKKEFREITKKDDRVHLYSHYGSDDPDVILSTIRFMAGSCNCKYIFLDHITMVVTGLQGEDERRALDYISTRLAMMVEELDFTLFLISHVNDEGKTRGSRNVAKVADLRIDLSRDIKAADDNVRNTTFLTVSKNRYAGKSGPAGALFFDLDTYVLEEIDPDAPPF